MIVLLSPDEIREDEPEIVASLFSLGLDRYHIRREQFNWENEHKKLSPLLDDYSGRISFHHEVNSKFGRHFKSHEKIDLQKGRVNSASFHKVEGLKSLGGLDYCFLSPVFPSISKTGYGIGSVIKSEFESREEKHPTKVVALGGVKPENIPELGTVWGGIAIKGCIWREENLDAIITTFKEVVVQWKKRYW